MPRSSVKGKLEVKEKLKKLKKIKAILDVGAGVGTYKELLQDVWPKALWVGCEIWRPYIKKYKLKDIYNLVISGDICTTPAIYNFDLVIFGDVLEHMSKTNAIKVYTLWRNRAKHILIAIPITYSPQGAEHGNPYEKHRAQWTHKEVLEKFKGVKILWKNERKGYYLASR